MVFNNSILLGAAGQGGAATFDSTLIGNSVWLNGSDEDINRTGFTLSSDGQKEFIISMWVNFNEFNRAQQLFILGNPTGIASFNDDTQCTFNADNTIGFSVATGGSSGGGITTTRKFRDIGWYHLLFTFNSNTSVLPTVSRIQLYVNGELQTGSLTAVPDNQDVRGSLTGNVDLRFGKNTHPSLGYFYKGYYAQVCYLEGKSIQAGDFAVSDFLDTFTMGTNGSQFIPKQDSDIAALATTVGGNSFCLDFSTASVALSSGVTPTSNAGTVSGSLSNLTDGNFTTEWRSNIDPATNVSNDHVTFDLGSAKDVKAVKITGRASATGNYKVQFSDNGSDFTDTGTTFSNVSITTTANSGILDLTSDNPGSHRYWKLINISNSSGTSGWGFREIILDSAVGNLGTDASGNGNDLTPNSISSVNQSISTPSKTYSVFNPNAKRSSAFTLSNGNRTAVTPGTDQWIKTTIPFVMSGSNIIRAEFTFDSVGQIGVGITGSLHTTGTYYTNTAAGRGEVALFTNSGALGLVVDGNFNNPAFGGSDGLSNGDIVDVFVNCDVGAVYFAVNGTIKGGASQSDIQNGVTTNAAQAGGSFVRRTAGEVFNFYIMQVNPSAGTITANTGQTAFTHSYSSITSLTSLNTADLTAPDYQGIDYFDSTIYEGNGTGQRVGDFVPFTDAYTVTNSVMFDDGDSRSLTLNSSATRTSATVAAFSLWTKRANLGTNQRPLTVQVDGSNYFSIYYNTSDQLDFTINNGGSTILQRITNRVFKDNSAWHNIVVIINQGESTQADRVKVFYDGVQIPNDSTGFGTNTCTLDGSSALNFLDSASAVHDVGGGSSTGFTQPYDGYVSEVAFLDGADSGAKLNASDFGQVDTSTNRWVPKDIGSYDFGNTGYYLEFKVAPGTGNGAGTDTSGESNNFTSNGSWATTDQFSDCPSQNFNVFDGGLNAVGTLSEGGTKIVTATNQTATYTTMNIPSTGKWYWEVDITSYATNGGVYFGLHEHDELNTGNAGVTSTAVIFQDYNGTANVYDSSNSDATWCNSVSANGFVSSGDVLQFALDQDAGTLFIGNNNTWFRAGGARDTFANATTVGTVKFPTGISRRFFVGRGGSFASTYTLNFGQQANEFSGSSTTFNAAADGFFVYTPPTGYKALNQDNLDDTASKITAWAWIKNRDATDNHILVDRVRGVDKDMHSNDTAAEVTNMNTVQRFLQRGVQVGNDVEVNTASESYVLWQWLIGDSATTGSSITAGSPSLTTTGIVADADHFSILSYTGNATGGATIAHGMSAAPEMIWIKERDNANGWIVGSDVVGYTKILRLDTTDAATTDSGAFNDTAPSATLITLGSNNGTNRSSGKMICYAFRSVSGVCKIGSYIGNGNNDGPYISTGFSPKYVLVKSLAASRNWNTLDTVRNPTNIASPFVLLPNSTAVDTAGQIGAFDILADGFKPRDTAANSNASGEEYLYMAIADIGGNGTLPPIYGR